MTKRRRKKRKRAMEVAEKEKERMAGKSAATILERSRRRRAEERTRTSGNPAVKTKKRELKKSPLTKGPVSLLWSRLSPESVSIISES